MIATASTGATARPAAAEDVTVAAVSASHALRSSESGDSDRASMDSEQQETQPQPLRRRRRPLRGNESPHALMTMTITAMYQRHRIYVLRKLLTTTQSCQRLVPTTAISKCSISIINSALSTNSRDP